MLKGKVRELDTISKMADWATAVCRVSRAKRKRRSGRKEGVPKPWDEVTYNLFPPKEVATPTRLKLIPGLLPTSAVVWKLLCRGD